MNKEGLKRQYDELFPNAEEKAKSFDKIAEQFYFCNFGTMQKTDIETLLFSLYLDRILEDSEANMQTYSDYTLSKILGITQNRVSALKERKQLKYPYVNFKWEESFKRIMQNARYEKGKIKINIPDRNLFIEVKNAIESNGGYIETQMSANLLQVAPEYYIDLILCVSDETNRTEIRKKLKESFQQTGIGSDKDTDYLEKKSIGDILKENKGDMAALLIGDLISSCIPVSDGVIKKILEYTFSILPKRKNQ